MQKTTQGDLSKKILKYGALSAAVMGLADANGQIVYTDVDPDLTLAQGAFDNIDIDNNTIDDYQLNNTSNGIYLFPINPAGTAIGPPNGFVGFQSGNYGYPSNLGSAVTVDSNSPNVIGGQGTFIYGSCSFSSQWCGGVTDGYAGILIDIAGNTHYGWARFDVAADRTSITLKDFAYNSVAGDPILTGQQVLGIDDLAKVDFSYFVDDNQTLNITSNEPLSNMTIYSVLGKEVMTQDLSSSSAQVSIANLSSGVYLAKLDINGTKKTFKFVRN